ncbi:hypothetical protein ABI_39740 [Asticcacaulis biprosthecium C19]|uniref:Lipoprotein n=1 Tax=Asticcacaulis biprosthecium C19 TaxID=715226 RepID=F4QS37_9CAUL|nr:hypothetical protein [Asticcacaulis biprosthecium]EGF89557.1 hypothetical protein ABI_39740 [Asticcacaulis biprosthecium C19]
MRFNAILILAALAGCSAPPKTEAPKPSQAAADTFTGCEWQEVKGKTLSIWSYACGPTFGGVRLIADDNLPGFSLKMDSESGSTVIQPVIRVFTKPADAPIESILPQIRAASPGKDTATCSFEEITMPPLYKDEDAVYQLAPMGEAKARWDKNVGTGEDPTPPCGDLGVAFSSNQLFEIMKDDPTKVVYINYGSEIQVFDTTTLKSLKR